MCMVHVWYVYIVVTVYNSYIEYKEKWGKVSTYRWNYVAIVNCYENRPHCFFHFTNIF